MSAPCRGCKDTRACIARGTCRRLDLSGTLANAREWQDMRYRVRCYAVARGARMVPNLLGAQYDTPIGPGMSQAHARRMSAQ